MSETRKFRFGECVDSGRSSAHKIRRFLFNMCCGLYPLAKDAFFTSQDQMTCGSRR